jgi:hypothetical protein
VHSEDLGEHGAEGIDDTITNKTGAMDFMFAAAVADAIDEQCEKAEKLRES